MPVFDDFVEGRSVFLRHWDRRKPLARVAAGDPRLSSPGIMAMASASESALGRLVSSKCSGLMRPV